MKRYLIWIPIIVIVAALLVGCDAEGSPPKSLPTSSPTVVAPSPTIVVERPTSTRPPATATVPPTSTSAPTDTPVPATSTRTPTETAPPPTFTRTPQPTASPTATPSATATRTPTSTETPTPTNTPSPTATPTQTPTPEPMCEVLAGALNMRYGPGVVYAPPILVLEQGTTLRPLACNEDGTWIQGQVGEAIGWVSMDADLVACNVGADEMEVAEAPPTPTPIPTSTATPTPDVPVGLEPAPVLQHPPSQTEIDGPWIELYWSWYRHLRPGEYYDVRVYYGGQPAWGIAWTQTPKFTVDSNRSVWQHGPGWYRWRIAVIEGHDGQMTRQVSELSEEWVFIWGGNGGLRINYGAARSGYKVRVRKSGVDRTFTVRSDGWIDTGLTLPPGQYTVNLYTPSGEQGCMTTMILWVKTNKYTELSEPPC